jgi:hypothetical protein
VHTAPFISGILPKDEDTNHHKCAENFHHILRTPRPDINIPPRFEINVTAQGRLQQSPVANCCTSDASFSYSSGRPALLSIGALLPPPSRFKRISRVRCIRASLNYSDAHTTPAPAIKGRGYFLVLCHSREELHYDCRNRNKHNPKLEQNAQPTIVFKFVDDPE